MKLNKRVELAISTLEKVLNHLKKIREEEISEENEKEFALILTAKEYNALKEELGIDLKELPFKSKIKSFINKKNIDKAYISILKPFPYYHQANKVLKKHYFPFQIKD